MQGELPLRESSWGNHRKLPKVIRFRAPTCPGALDAWSDFKSHFPSLILTYTSRIRLVYGGYNLVT